LPASSYSSSVSWSVYFAAAVVLVGTCSPVLSGVKSYSCGDSAAETASGAVEVVDSLAPGMVVTFSFHAPSPSDSIELGGQELTAVWCGRPSAFQTAWQLPSAVLTAGVTYYLRLTGNQVEVSGFV
jgi:hypothetical protein